MTRHWLGLRASGIIHSMNKQCLSHLSLGITRENRRSVVNLNAMGRYSVGAMNIDCLKSYG